MQRTFEQIKAVILKKGYAFFEEGDYNLNLIAVRENDVFENTFSDTFYCIYKEQGIWRILELPWTTLAGLYGKGGEKNPYTAKETGTLDDGVAVILEGQYRGVYQFVENGWRYPFTVYYKQIKEMDYLRDNDKNGVISRATAKKVRGEYATHLHSMSNQGQSQGLVSYQGFLPWSAGCNGCPDALFQKLVAITRKAVAKWGSVFTYTLLHANDFK